MSSKTVHPRIVLCDDEPAARRGMARALGASHYELIECGDGLTNLAALRLPADARLYSQWLPACGLVSCVGLAFWVEPGIWLAGLGLIAIGLVWHVVARRMAPTASQGTD